MWKVETDKGGYISVTDGNERIHLGCGRIDKLGKGRTKTDQKHIDLAFKIANALNKYEDELTHQPIAL